MQVCICKYDLHTLERYGDVTKNTVRNTVRVTLQDMVQAASARTK